MGMFDDILTPQSAAPPPAKGGMFDDIVAPKTAAPPDAPAAPTGPPSVPISGNNLDYSKIPQQQLPPSVPISGNNIDYSKIPGAKEDPKITAEKQREAKVQAIAQSLRPPNEFPTGVADFVTDKAFLSMQRPPMAFLNALLMKAQGKHPDASLQELYQGSDRYLNDRLSRAEEKTGPVAPLVGAAASLPASMLLSGAGRVAGAPAAVTPGVRAAATAPASTLKVMGQAAIPGFVEGASSNAETLGDAVYGGAKNAASSALLAGGLDKVGQYVLPAAKRGAAAEAQAAKGIDPAAQRDAADTFYKEMKNAGVRYDAKQTLPLYTALQDMRDNFRFSKEGTPELRGYFKDLQKLARNEMSYEELQNMRSAVAGKIRSGDDNTRRAAGEIVGHIDRVIRDAPAINPNNLDMAKTHRQASELWKSSNVAADLDLKAGKAGRMVDAGKDVNPDAKLRDELFNMRERLLKKENYNPLDEKQMNLLDRAIEGGGSADLKRKAGDFLVDKAGTIGATAGAGATLAGLTHGNSPGWAAVSAATGFPFWAGAHLGGKALQNSAAGARMGDVNALLRDISGSPKLPPGAAISRDDLAKILFTQDLERIAPRVTSAAIGDKREEKKGTKK